MHYLVALAIGFFISNLGQVHPPPAEAGLPLTVVVDGGVGRAEVVEFSEFPGAEVLVPHRSVHRPATQLPEQHEDEAVDF